jgi:hypothetical protein
VTLVLKALVERRVRQTGAEARRTAVEVMAWESKSGV